MEKRASFEDCRSGAKKVDLPLKNGHFLIKARSAQMGTRYSEEFKWESVLLGLSSEQPYSTTARDLGINCKTFYRWISDFMSKQETSLIKQPRKSDYQEFECQNKAMRK